MKRFEDKSMKAAYKYARAQTAHYSKSFYLSSAMLPKEKRWDTYALYSFCRYADNIVDNPRNRPAELLVEEVDYVAKELKIGYERGESEHPILKPFIDVARKHGIPIKYALELLEGVKMDLQRNRYETYDDLYLFAYRVAGTVGLMMSYIIGFKSPETLKYAEKLGIAMQLTNILRDVQEDKNMNRIYLPLDELKAYGLTEDDLFRENMSDQMRAFMSFQIKRAHNYYKKAQPGVKMLSRDSQYSIYAAGRIYRGILYKIEARNYNPFLGRVFVRQSKKLLILFNELFKSRIVQPAVSFFV